MGDLSAAGFSTEDFGGRGGEFFCSWVQHSAFFGGVSLHLTTYLSIAGFSTVVAYFSGTLSQLNVAQCIFRGIFL